MRRKGGGRAWRRRGGGVWGLAGGLSVGFGPWATPQHGAVGRPIEGGGGRSLLQTVGRIQGLNCCNKQMQGWASAVACCQVVRGRV